VVPWHSAAVPNPIHLATAREALSAPALALAATLLAQAQAGTSAEFALASTIDAKRRLTITLHEVYLALAKRPMEGPAGVEASRGCTMDLGEPPDLGLVVSEEA